MKPDWTPFRLSETDERIAPRPITTLEGVGDRLRSAAWAEIQAREAFRWAARTLTDAPEDLKNAWLTLSIEEEKHMNWLLTRLTELGMSVVDRPVSDHLWMSFMNCISAEQFAVFMANAEERGRKAGVRFYQDLEKRDPVTAKIFGTIAEEEIAHIALAQKYFPKSALLRSV
ncbi:MAG: DUF455 family protein [Xanthomonadaceae bacterium]|nr:DUF455 family protein [Xanthomonadaceae bacterium]